MIFGNTHLNTPRVVIERWVPSCFPAKLDVNEPEALLDALRRRSKAFLLLWDPSYDKRF